VPGTRRAGRATRDSTGQITISAPRRETRAARDEDRASRPSALTPFTSSLPVDAAVEARIKAREIKISWREQGQIKTASLDDLSEVPDDVLATLYQALTEELARRTRQASE
jgi:hypothetical protein